MSSFTQCSFSSSDQYVTSESGTGIVHQAPGFGEDDFRVCLRYNVFKKGDRVVCPVDASGRFTDEITDFKGQYVKVSGVITHSHTHSLSLVICRMLTRLSQSY